MNRRATATFVLAGLVVALLLVVVLAPHASSSPDGLEKVAADREIDASALPHAMADGPLADYGVDGIDDESTGTIVAGIIGVSVVFVASLGLFALVRIGGRRRSAPAG